MAIDPQELRIEGVYEQRQPGNFMLRVKVPAGTLSAEQAMQIADIAERFAGGAVHVTTRGSIELHWLKGHVLAEVWRMLAAVGLTTRGACGGAVRGVTCGPVDSVHFPVVHSLAGKLHLHFTRNPHFEGLPKKFKIGVFADGRDGRHLIQDLALVLAEAGSEPRFDVWTAGGLGREPSPGFLLEAGVPEERIIPLVEAVVRVYKEQAPKGKRLKHLVRETGRDVFRRLVAELRQDVPLPLTDSFTATLFPASPAEAPATIEAPVFAGELSTDELRDLAAIAREHAGGFMALTGDQNVFLRLADASGRGATQQALARAGFGGEIREQRVSFRVCPGSHECRMGLAPTRDVALAVIKAMGEAGLGRAWSISGCPNSCSQPQLAAEGIVTVKSVKGDDGERRPLFDILRRDGGGQFGSVVRQGLSLDELLEEVRLIG